LAQEPPALFEAALWIAAEHLPAYSPAHALRELGELAQEPPALFEAALWIAAEHLPAYSPAHALRELG
ncbi:hypothetical protein ACLXBB_37385, partial [Pseudomonas aeruginosa]